MSEPLTLQDCIKAGRAASDAAANRNANRADGARINAKAQTPIAKEAVLREAARLTSPDDLYRRGILKRKIQLMPSRVKDE